jgi:inorganic pyrophosphatase
MRSLFNVFDKDGDGKIGEGDLRALHARLGEPISEEEARGAVEMIGQGLGAVTFADFAAFWDGSHVSLKKQLLLDEGVASPDVLQAERAKRRAHYTAKFTFLRAKVPSPALARVSTEACGPCPSLEYRLRFYYDAGPALGGKVEISPWHDVPLFNADGTLNMIVEIPKWSRRKFEIATREPLNPIKIDVKNGQLREYNWGDMLCNYGAFPQTWEDPKHVDPNTRCGGDNDPLDVIDVGNRRWDTGAIVRVKVLGVLALIDAGETDWKVLAISAEDPLAPLLNDIDDVRVHIPGVMEALTKWLRLYKSPVINDFAFGGEAQTRDFAEALIRDTHESWKALVEERGGGSSGGGGGGGSGGGAGGGAVGSGAGGASTGGGAEGNSILAAGLKRSGSAGQLASLTGHP